jgi:hypothetical protein
MTKVTDPKPRVVCVTTGHGEREVTIERKQEDDEPTSVANLFERAGYHWQEVVLGQEQNNLRECRLLFAYGPTQDFTERETQQMARFHYAGGNLLLLLDPGSFPQIERLLERHRIFLGEPVTVDMPDRLYLRDRSTVPAVDVALATRLPEQFTAVLYTARQVNFIAERQGARGGVFLGYRSATRGLIPVGVAEETGGDQAGRIMIVGDSDFLSGALFRRESNRVLFARMLSWLGDRNPERYPTHERYAYTPLSLRQTRWLLWTVLLPSLGFLLAGMITWWRRRVA